MAHWDSQISLRHFFHAELSIQEKAKNTARALTRFVETQQARPPNRQVDWFDAEGLADDFEALAGEAEATAEDFDAILSDLYDWADAERVWIATR